MLGAGNVCKAQVTFAGRRPAFCPNCNFYEGNGQWGNSRGAADFEVTRTPIGLPFPGKRTIFRAVPQLVLLNEVDTQY